MIGGTAYIPFRFVAESLGGQVLWNPVFKRAIVLFVVVEAKVAIGRNTALRNGREILLDDIVLLVGGRTFVPVQVVSEALGCQVEWNPMQRTIRVVSPYDQRDVRIRILE